MHKMFAVTRKGKLFSAPLNIAPGQRRNILDLGCGTGIWAIDVAESVCHYHEASQSANTLHTALTHPTKSSCEELILP